MNELFAGLSQADYEKLKNAVVLIAVYIAGADGHIDRKEKEWAEKVTTIRSYSLPKGLKEFYIEVGEDFTKKLNASIDKYEGPVNLRNQKIADQLSELNEIFPKFTNPQVAVTLYESFKSFAQHVARAPGGFLSWGTINPHEARLINLDMIDPVVES